MAITTLSSREFNQDTSRAKKAAKKGPVFITDRGRPAHVLLSIEEYRKMSGKRKNIAEALAMPEAALVEFRPAPPGGQALPSRRFLVMYLLDTNVVSELRKVRCRDRRTPRSRAGSKAVDVESTLSVGHHHSGTGTGNLLMERRDPRRD